MNIGRIFASAIVRRVAYVVVSLVFAAVVSMLGMGEARAAHVDANRGAAYQHCRQRVDAYVATILGMGYEGAQGQCDYETANGGQYRECVTSDDYPNCGALFPAGDGLHRWAVTCPNPTEEWNESLKRCFDPEECLARNGAENGMPLDPVAKPFRDKCVAGCSLSMQSGTGSCTVISFAGQSQTHCNGVFQYTGNTCDATPPDDDDGPEPNEDSCTPTGPNSGTKFCKKKDGRECFESNSGAMICWGTGETGQRTTGADAQTRGAGSDEPQPDPPTPPETFDPSKKGDPTTTTTTTEHPNGSTTTTTTTVINNSTTNGTNPPGTPGSNPGSGGSSEGGDDDDGNEASGGGSCTDPPVITGDPALGMIATQQWETRCALEKIGEGSTVTGDVGDCDSPFTVEGDDANAQRLRAMREQICPGGSEAANGDGNAIDWSGLDGPDSAEGSGLFVDEEIGADGLDTTGLGFIRTCPTIPPVEIMGTTIQLDNSVMCDWLELGGQIMLILAALVSVRIMAGVGT